MALGKRRPADAGNRSPADVISAHGIFLPAAGYMELSETIQCPYRGQSFDLVIDAGYQNWPRAGFQVRVPR